MKKLPILLLALVMVLTACVSDNPPEISITPTTTAATVPTTVPTTVPETEPAAVLQAGYYLPESMASNDSEMDISFFEDMKLYIQINADHTAVISIMGVPVELTWNDTELLMDGDPVKYALDGDLLIMDPGTDKEMTFRYHGDTLPESYLAPKLTSGYFVVSSVGQNGDVSFYGTLSPENGYLKLNGDGTGVLYYDGVESDLTWDESNLYVGDNVYPYTYHPSEETGDDLEMIAVYMLEAQISLVLRPAQEPAR